MSDQTVISDQFHHLKLYVRMPASVEHLSIIMNGADVPGGGPMEKSLKWKSGQQDPTE
jgi:hypothetical protein